MISSPCHCYSCRLSVWFLVSLRMSRDLKSTACELHDSQTATFLEVSLDDLRPGPSQEASGWRCISTAGNWVHHAYGVAHLTGFHGYRPVTEHENERLSIAMLDYHRVCFDGFTMMYHHLPCFRITNHDRNNKEQIFIDRDHDILTTTFHYQVMREPRVEVPRQSGRYRELLPGQWRSTESVVGMIV